MPALTPSVRGLLARHALALFVVLTWWNAARGADLPTIESRPPTFLGLGGVSLNARIHPHGEPATWHIEYGPTTDYVRKSKPKPLPPRLAAFYRESWDDGWNGWRSWDARHLHFKKGGASEGHIRYESIARDDHNHDDGIGTVHLAKYFYPGRMAPIPSANLAAGDPDLRDAIVRIAVRGVNWQPNGTELMWWSQSQSNIEINPDDHTFAPGYKHPNWAYTGHNLTDLLLTGRWERAEYRLLNDTNAWSYCGNNKGEARYDAYWSIDEVQRHLNVDCFHMVIFVDPANRPTGAIDFDEFELAYRNYSLLFPANGARLTSAPAGSDDDDDAAALTDGWRHGPKRAWRSAARPSGPLEFTWELARPVTVEAVQIHQHPDWPARNVEVLVSEDGKTWESLVRGEMPEKASEGPNFAYLLRRKLKAPARHARLRLQSGYRTEHWGLGEIELFGAGAVFPTDDDWYHINGDLTGLTPGATLHYRIVATSAAGVTRGPDQQVTLPADTKPHVLTGQATRISAGTAKVEGRLNPFGRKTEFHFEYGPTDKYGNRTKSFYGGLQITPRLVFASLSGLKAGTLYHYRLVATNETGTSYGGDATFAAK